MGIGWCYKVTLLLWHLRLTDSWIRHDDFLDGAAKQLCLGRWQCRNIENRQSQMVTEGRCGVQAPSSNPNSCHRVSNHLSKLEADCHPRVTTYDRITMILLLSAEWIVNKSTPIPNWRHLGWIPTFKNESLRAGKTDCCIINKTTRSQSCQTLNHGMSLSQQLEK